MDDLEPERMLIRVFPDYGAGWPVWAPDGLTSPEDFPSLSPRLVADLTAWQEQWEADNNRPERYRNGYSRRGSQAELDRLARHLAAKLRDLADVETDTWSSKTRLGPPAHAAAHSRWPASLSLPTLTSHEGVGR